MLKKKAITLGATDAKVISVKSIPVDPRIIELCKTPGCEGFGQCANCPPHVMDAKMAARWITSFDRGLVIKLDLLPSQIMDSDYLIHFRKMFMMVTALERIAKQRGFGGATALGAGSCKPVFCPEKPCAVLKGKDCSYAHLARPSLEAIGINVFQLCRTLGWSIHKILRDTDPKTIPSASLVGLVLF